MMKEKKTQKAAQDILYTTRKIEIFDFCDKNILIFICS